MVRIQAGPLDKLFVYPSKIVDYPGAIKMFKRTIPARVCEILSAMANC